MKSVNGYPKDLEGLLSSRYTVPYYQREYKWGSKQMGELIDDLIGEFSRYYLPEHGLKDVRNYGMYFLGSIIITKDKDIIDGQQRLTSLTLMLIYLNHLQKRADVKKVAIDQLIYTESYGEKAFVINDSERNDCMAELYDKGKYTALESDSESVLNLVDRYDDIAQHFEDTINQESLPLFLEWMKKKVSFIEIEAESIDDAHVIFESMNDRGLRLSAVEMLKGFVLARISGDEARNKANDVWKKWMKELNDSMDNGDSIFVNTWLRAKYASSIRERKAGAQNQDYELIANMANKWVAQNKERLNLRTSTDYENLVLKEIPFYASVFLKINSYANKFDDNFEYVFYNSNREFTLQTQLIIASIATTDSESVIDEKIRLVSFFVDQYVTMRTFAFKSVSYSSTLYAMFNITKEIRDLSSEQLYEYVKRNTYKLQEEFSFDNIDNFVLNQFTSRYMLHNLARIEYYIYKNSNSSISFSTIVDRKGKDSLDIEHIWSTVYEQDGHPDEFETVAEFEQFRNKFGGLVLLTRNVNRSLQEAPYSEKLAKYAQGNILAKTLHSDCYRNEPGFLNFMENTGLKFKPYTTFDKTALEERQKLYKEIAMMIWDIENLEQCVQM